MLAPMVSLDVTKPNTARMYDYWLGGKDNYEADREAAEAIRRQRPNIAQQALDNKRFQTRAISQVAGQGVRQFLDIGSGLPTSPVQGGGARPRWLATHEAARAVIPDAVVGYLDYDPVAVAHSQALLASGSDQVVAAAGDMRDPEAILAGPALRGAGFSLAEPACVVLCCVLHFLDAAAARDVVGRFRRALAPGSYLIISVGYAGGQAGRAVRQHLQRAGRLPDLRPLLGRDHRPVRRPRPGPAGHRGRGQVAGRPAGDRPRRARLHDRRRGGPPALNSRCLTPGWWPVRPALAPARAPGTRALERRRTGAAGAPWRRPRRDCSPRAWPGCSTRARWPSWPR